MAERLGTVVRSGGIAEWVALDEVGALRREIAALADTAALKEWARGGSSLTPILRSRAGRAFTQVLFFTAAGRHASVGNDPRRLTAGDRRQILAAAVVNLADSRRDDAIRSFAEEQQIPLGAATGADTARLDECLARCPACDAPVTRLGDLYCSDHTREQTADIAALIDAAA